MNDTLANLSNVLNMPRKGKKGIYWRMAFLAFCKIISESKFIKICCLFTFVFSKSFPFQFLVLSYFETFCSNFDNEGIYNFHSQLFHLILLNSAEKVEFPTIFQ